jgi:hypothetical protein
MVGYEGALEEDTSGLKRAEVEKLPKYPPVGRTVTVV